ncbi:UNKNOWN [Stylonychia lemnae]|uniref:Transmembrane protein n=1 Tax=Stylonychia lemnae TaxID=5949 RepID=A0A078B6R4_STYLE|nr:UNKNOWN [Stylonychia lemnae]|eukprot:CDW89258.1 UNKNOWN [Stylonychia lemnae]
MVGIIGINILLNQLNLVVQIFLAIYLMIKRKILMRKLKKLKDQQEKKNALDLRLNLVETMNLSKNISFDSQSPFTSINFDDDGLIVQKPTKGIQQIKQKVIDFSKGRKTLQLIRDLIIPKTTEQAKQEFNSITAQVSSNDSFQSVQDKKQLAYYQDPSLQQGKFEILDELIHSPKVHCNNTVKNGGQFSKTQNSYDEFEYTHQDLLHVDSSNQVQDKS